MIRVYRTVSVGGARVRVSTGGGVFPAGAVEAVGYVDLFPFYDGRKGSADLADAVAAVIA